MAKKSTRKPQEKGGEHEPRHKPELRLGPPARHARFVDEYLVDFNATAAAIRAGYARASAASQGWDLLRNPKVQELIREKAAELEKRVHISQEFVIRSLVQSVRISLGLDKVNKTIVTKDGHYDAEVYLPSPAAADRGLEILGKYKELGLWKETQEVSFVSHEEALKELEKKESEEDGEDSGTTEA